MDICASGPSDGEARSLLASIVESSDDAVVGKTLQGVVTSWNAAAERIFGYSAAEMIGHPIARIFPLERIGEEDALLERLKSGERIDHYETERIRKDGERVLVSVTISPIRDGAGAIVGASKIARDITERKNLERRLGELQAELLHVGRLNDMGQMSFAFAHELNQPLAALSNYVAGAKALIQRGESQKAIAGCDLAQQQVLRAGAVICRLRDFVRKAEFERRPEEIVPVIHDSIALANVSLKQDNMSMALEVASDASRVLIDRVQIQQVLVNLMRNAIEAMAALPAPALSVCTRIAAGGMVEVAVEDAGPGLAEAVKAKLFQPFNTTKSEGLGVGLSLCRSIVEGHGGRIWAENSQRGGAVFLFTLPAA